ncbi:hypothetical protein MKX03_022011 [Papaver bracteatum]|nr:hypothetical protein MKX03_022011 [Papaver bracteatum]
MGGGMEVNKNTHIEDWNAFRENLEHKFRWNRRNFAIIGLFGIAIPVLVYKGIVRDFISSFDYQSTNRSLSCSHFDLFLCLGSFYLCPNFFAPNFVSDLDFFVFVKPTFKFG